MCVIALFLIRIAHRPEILGRNPYQKVGPLSVPRSWAASCTSGVHCCTRVGLVFDPKLDRFCIECVTHLRAEVGPFLSEALERPWVQKWARLLYPLALLLGPISHGFGSAATTYAHFLERALCAPRCRTLQNAEMLGTLPLAMGLDANELLACAKLNACMGQVLQPSDTDREVCAPTWRPDRLVRACALRNDFLTAGRPHRGRQCGGLATSCNTAP
jgi:hypothetical protein